MPNQPRPEKNDSSGILRLCTSIDLSVSVTPCLPVSPHHMTHPLAPGGTGVESAYGRGSTAHPCAVSGTVVQPTSGATIAGQSSTPQSAVRHTQHIFPLPIPANSLFPFYPTIPLRHPSTHPQLPQKEEINSLMLLINTTHQRRCRRQDVVDKDEDGLFRGELDAFTDDVDKLTDG